MDNLSNDQRSALMSRIRGSGTKPEKIVRSLLHKMGFRFRHHAKNLPGTPDIVLPKYKTVIFVHGCFWHQHPGCKRSFSPKSNSDLWSEKLRRNVVRDREVSESLQNMGWKVLTVWECELKKSEELIHKLVDQFNNV
jgi:DNA mismatch endonuclease (patch repair protein)